MTAMMFCKRHERAHRIDEGCTYCVGEREDRTRAKVEAKPRRIQPPRGRTWTMEPPTAEQTQLAMARIHEMTDAEYDEYVRTGRLWQAEPPAASTRDDSYDMLRGLVLPDFSGMAMKAEGPATGQAFADMLKAEMDAALTARDTMLAGLRNGDDMSLDEAVRVITRGRTPEQMHAQSRVSESDETRARIEADVAAAMPGLQRAPTLIYPVLDEHATYAALCFERRGCVYTWTPETPSMYGRLTVRLDERVEHEPALDPIAYTCEARQWLEREGWSTSSQYLSHSNTYYLGGRRGREAHFTKVTASGCRGQRGQRWLDCAWEMVRLAAEEG